jgi:hypothetical protein
MKKTYLIILDIEILGANDSDPALRSALFNLVCKPKGEDSLEKVPLNEILWALKRNSHRMKLVSGMEFVSGMGLFNGSILGNILTKGTIKNLQMIEIDYYHESFIDFIEELGNGVKLYRYDTSYLKTWIQEKARISPGFSRKN